MRGRLSRWEAYGLDRYVLGHGSRGFRERMTARLRGDERLRAAFDERVAALRELEGREVAEPELELVAGRLFGAQGVEPERRTVRVLALALVGAAAIAMVVRPEPGEDGFGVRGGDGRGALAFEALCADDGDAAAAASWRPAIMGCARGGLVTFAYRVDLRAAPDAEFLTIFGIDASGRPLYYAPVPGEVSPRVEERSRMRALGPTVRLAVNHEPGFVRVYALLAPLPATSAHVDRLAAALDGRGPTRDGERWTAGIPHDVLQDLCPRPEACEAAESGLLISASTTP